MTNLPVTQNDIDAADLLFIDCKLAEPYHSRAIQAFARHRQSHSLPGDVGMRDLVKALREAPDPVFNPSDDWTDLYAEWHQETRDLAALTPSELSGKVAEHVETLNWLSSQYLPGGPRDVKGAIHAAVNALTPKALCQHGPTDPMQLCNDCEAEPSALSGDAGEGEKVAAWLEQYPTPLDDLDMAMRIRQICAAIRNGEHLK